MIRIALLAFLSAPAQAQLVGGQWEPIWQFDGQNADALLGSSVSGAGDVDGDGVDDLIVGSPGASPGGLSQAGSAYVYSGATGNLIWQFDGQTAGDELGASVSGAEDVDGDGFDDLIVGADRAAPGGLPGAGSAFVFSGATGNLLGQLDGQAAHDYLGTSVAGAGDVDGDGVSDLIVGAYSADPGGLSGAGSAYVYSGASGNLIWRFDGQNAGDNMGFSVSGGGDVDADGFDDLIVGAFSADPGGVPYAGSAYVYSGASGNLIWQFNGQNADDWLGLSVSGAGDVDSDGYDDLIVGAAGADPSGLTDAGSAYVYSGATGNLVWRFDGQDAGDNMGISVSGAGDVDGNGVDDLIVGARGADPGGLSGAGSAYIYSGASGNLLGRFDGQSSVDLLGISVSGVGDINGDGLHDLIVAANQANPGGLSNAGSAYVFSLDPFLHLSADGISYAAGQPVQLGLDFPVSEAGEPFAILVSLTGTGPSQLNGLTLPLTQDATFQRFLGSPSLTGALNVNARALVQVRLHRQTPPSAIGRTLHLAAVTFDAGTQVGRLSSIARSLQIIP